MDFYEKVGSHEDSTTVILNFHGIEAATASYLKKFFSPLLGDNETKLNSKAIFPVVTGLSDDLRDDLFSVFSDKGWVVCEAKIDGKTLSFVRLLGKPETTTETTFHLLKANPKASATSMFESSSDKTVAQTAWNNRLTTLFRLRLAKRFKEGRVWLYQTTFN